MAVDKKKAIENMLSTKWNELGSFQYYVRYQSLGNESVGRVTVRHMIWAEIKTAIKAWKQAREMKDEKGCAFYAQHISVLYHWLKWVCLSNQSGFKNFKQAPFTEPKFISPLAVEMATSGVNTRKVAEKAIYLAVYKAKFMYLYMGSVEACKAVLSSVEGDIPANVLLSLQNMDEFANVMIDAGRFCQELTIDAAKVYDKVVIILGEEMGRVRLKSRYDEVTASDMDEDGGVHKAIPYGAKFNFAKEVVETHHNSPRSTAPAGGDEKKKFSIADFFDTQRINAMRIPEAYKEAVFAIKPQVPADLLTRMEKISKEHSQVLPMVKLLQQFYHTLSDTDNRELAKLERFNISKEALAGHKRLVGKRRKKAYTALAAHLRSSMYDWTQKGTKAPISKIDTVCIVLGEALKAMAANKDANRPSSFVNIVLEEEFMMFIVDLYKDDDAVSTETRDSLAYCTFEDGAEAEFVDGHAKEGDTVAFVKDNIPDGRYTIRKDGHKAYACRDINKVLEERLPESSDKEMVFCTIALPASSFDADALQARLYAAKEVMLIPVIKEGIIDNQKHGDLVIADGEVVANFQNKVAGKVDRFINSFYEYKKGKVSFCRRAEWRGERGELMITLFVALEEVSKGTLADVKSMDLHFGKNYVSLEAAEAKAKAISEQKSKAAFDKLFGSDSDEETEAVVSTASLDLLNSIIGDDDEDDDEDDEPFDLDSIEEEKIDLSAFNIVGADKAALELLFGDDDEEEEEEVIEEEPEPEPEEAADPFAVFGNALDAFEDDLI